MHQPRSFLPRACIFMVLITLGMGAIAAAEGVRKRVRFPRGKTSIVLEGALVRGDSDRYILGARAGQTMTVRVTALEDNAVFDIYRPGGKQTLAGAGAGDEATEWNGKLPASGDYTIVVSGTRGNASYKLEITIKGSGKN